MEHLSMYRKGTNQFEHKTKFIKGRTWLSILAVILFFGALSVDPYTEHVLREKQQQIKRSLNLTTYAYEEPELAGQPRQEEIEAYIKTIFGKDAKVAIAVSRNECSPQNPYYPRCAYHTQYEYSVGIFQINLYNANHWIHAKKVPGETMGEKIEWLKDPFHNTLIAYKIFSDSGFTPWVAYTSNAYLKDL